MLAENYHQIKATIEKAAFKVGRNPREIKLIAVTKSASLEDTQKAAELGIKNFGVNRVQEETAKVESLPGVNWHFIGHLQRNKVKYIMPLYAMVQTLDRLSLARELQRWAEKNEREIDVLIQVNISGEDSKFGLAPQEVSSFLDQAQSFKRLNIKGLMAMAAFVDDPEEARLYFRQLRQLRDENVSKGLALPELSMGMTNDYAVAIEEGATMVRVGRALFGWK